MQVRGSTICWMIALVVWAFANASPAASPTSGNTSRQARDDAARAIPLAQLSADDRAKVNAVLEDVTLFRRLPTQTIECDMHLYRFLIEHPEVVISMWRVMGITDIHLSRLDDSSFEADDRAGTRGKLRYLLRSPELHLIYGEGKYEGALLPKAVRGQGVFMLRSTPYTDRDGRLMMQCRLDSFVRMELVTVEVLARTFQPLVGHVADHNYRETALFLNRIHRAAQVNPEGLTQLVAQLEGVDRDTVKGFSKITDTIATQAALNEQLQKTQPVPERAAELIPSRPSSRR
jgi:hypothetical protein